MTYQILKTSKELREYKNKHVHKRCPLCGREMRYVESKNQTVDHDHKTGLIRGILCRNCNGLEGRINNLCTRAGVHINKADFLYNIIKYWNTYTKPAKGKKYYYPGTTENNGRLIAPKKRRRKRR